MKGSYGALCFDIAVKTPVSHLRKLYSAATFLEGEPQRRGYVLVYFLSTIGQEPFPVAYVLEVLQWMMDECQFPLDVPVRPGRNIIDWVCDRHNRLPALAMINFVANRGLRPIQGWDACLVACIMPQLPFDGSLCKRLLDAGATCSLLEAANQPWRAKYVTIWYESRKTCRAACIALLGLRRRLPLVRACVAADVMRMIVKPLWRRHRWHWFE